MKIVNSKSIFLIPLLLSIFIAPSLESVVLTVTLNTDAVAGTGTFNTATLASGDLRGALNYINTTGGGGTYTINFALGSGNETISGLGAMLPVINLIASNNVTIDGSNSGGSGVPITLNGGTHRGFVCRQGTVTIQNMTFNSCTVPGITATNGGGAAMGAGGAILSDNANIILSNLTFTNCAVTGGTGASVVTAGGGSGMGSIGGVPGTAVSGAYAGGGGGGGLEGTGGAGGSADTSGAAGGGGGGGGISSTGGAGGSTSLSSLNNAGAGGGGGANSLATGGAGGIYTATNGFAGTSAGVINGVALGGGGGGGGPTGGAGGGGSCTGSAAGGGAGGGPNCASATTANGASGGNGGGGGGAGGNGTATGNGGAGGPGGGGGGAVYNGAGNISGGAGGWGGGGGGGAGGTTGQGGNGGWGGGGGAASQNSNNLGGGNGGFGGGGGSGSFANTVTPGGTGGFGGSGGGGSPGGTSGVGAGSSNGINGTGGGAGFGGAIFVNTGQLTIAGPINTSGNSASGGTAGTSSGAGASAGTDIFCLQYVGSINFNPSTGQVVTISGSIADDSLNSIPAFQGFTQGSGSGVGIFKQGAGTLALLGTNTYSGTLTLGGGVLKVNSAISSGGNSFGFAPLINTVGSSTIQATTGFSGTIPTVSFNNSTLILDTQAFVLETDTQLSGTGSLIKKGTGAFVLNAPNCNLIVGTFSILNGVVNTPGGSGLFLNGSQSINIGSGATLDLQTITTSQICSSLNTASGSGLVLGSLPLIYFGDFDNPSNTSTIAGNLVATNCVLSYSGNGTFSLTTPSNAWSGTMALDAAGPLVISNGTVLGSSDLLFRNAFNYLPTQGATLKVSQTINNLPNNVYVGDNNSYTSFNNIDVGSFNLNLTGNVTSLLNGFSVTSMWGIRKYGTGTLIFSGSGNTYVGTTFIATGTIQAGGINRLPSVSVIDLSSTGVTLDLNNFTNQVGGLFGSGGNVTLGSGTIILNDAATDTFGGVISGAGGLIFNGTGTLTLNATNTYTGSTTFQNGVLAISYDSSLGASGTLYFNGTGTLRLLSTDSTLARPVVINSGLGTIAVDGPSVTISSNISGPGGAGYNFTGSNPGSVVSITGTNTYSGSTTFTNTTSGLNVFAPASDTNLGASGTALNFSNGAVLQLGSSFSLAPITRNIVLNSGGGGIDTQGFTITESGSFIDSNSQIFTKYGTGTLIVNSANTNNSGIVINAGTIKAGTTNALSASSAVNLQNSTSVYNLNNFDSTVSTVFGAGSGLLLGTANLTFANANGILSTPLTGSGRWQLNNASSFIISPASPSYSGSVTINSGLVNIGNAQSFGTFGTVYFGSSNPNLSQVTNFNWGYNFYTTSNTTLGWNGGTTNNVNGTISGPGGMTYSLGGSLNSVFNITGTNSYTGTTSLLGPGGIIISQDSNLGIAGATFFFAGSVSPGFLQFSTNTFFPVTFTRPIVFQAGAGGTINTPGSVTLTNPITGLGGLSKQGTGTLVLSGSNNYTGSTLVGNGMIQASTTNTFSSVGLYSFSAGVGVTLDLNNFSNSIGTPSGGSSVGGNITLGSGTLTMRDTGGANTYSGAISGTGGAIYSGSGTLTLAGTNTFLGGLQLTGGSISSVRDGNLGAATGTFSFSPVNTATFTITGQFPSVTRPIVLTSGIAVFNLGAFSYNNSGNFTGTGSLQKAGTGTLTFSGTNNSYSGTTNLILGTILSGAANSFSPNSRFNLTNAAGTTLNLNNFNNSIGGLNGGGTVGGNVNLGTAFLTVNTSGADTYSGTMSGTGGFIYNGTGTMTLTGTSSYTGTASINKGTVVIVRENNLGANTSLQFNGSATLQLNASLPASTRNVTLGVGATGFLNTGTFSYTTTGVFTGGGGLGKSGPGTLTLGTAGSNYAGTTYLTGGMIQANALNALSGNSRVSMSSGTTLNLNNNNNQIGSLSGNGGVVDTGSGAGGILQLGSDGTSSTFNTGTIIGNGGLTKVGAGTFTIGTQSLNTYVGATTVNGGRLSVNGSINSAVTVQINAVLGGNGTINGNVIVQNGGTISPGNSIGIITVNGNLTLNSSSITNIELSPLLSSRIDVSGTAALAGTLQITNDPGTYFNTTWTVLTASGLTGGSTPFTLSVVNTDPNFSYSIIGNAVVVSWNNGAPPPPPPPPSPPPPPPGPPPPPSPTPTPGGGGTASTSLSFYNLGGNNLALAEYLNTIALTNPAIAALIFNDLSILPTADLEIALVSISPSRSAASGFATGQIAFQSGQILGSRNQESRFQRFAAEHGSFAAFLSRDEHHLLVMDNSYLDDGENQDESKEETGIVPHGTTIRAAKEKENYSFWVDAFGQFLHQGTQNQNPEFHVDTGGAFLGFDTYKVQSADFSGCLGYSRSRIAQDATSHMNSYSGSLSGTFYSGGYYLEMALAGAYNQFQNKRRVTFTGFDATAMSSHDGYLVAPHLGMGYDISFSFGALEPFIAADYVYMHEEGYTEHGASPLNMQINARHYSILRAEVGVNSYLACKWDWGLFFARETVSYINQQPFSVGKMNALIVGNAPGFTVTSLSNNVNIVRCGFELFLRGNNGLFGSINYSGEFSNNYNSNGIVGEIGKYF